MKKRIIFEMGEEYCGTPQGVSYTLSGVNYKALSQEQTELIENMRESLRSFDTEHSKGLVKKIKCIIELK